MAMRNLAAIAAAVVLTASATHAATLTSLSGMIPLTGGSYSQNIDFAQFDPTAGTLTGISITLFTRYSASVSGTYPLGTSTSHQVNFTGVAQLDGANGEISLSQNFGNNKTVIGCQSLCLDYGQMIGSISVSGADLLQMSQQLGAGDDLSPFIGGGLFTLDFTGYSRFGGSGVDLDPGSSAAVGGRVGITYSYDPAAPAVSSVPEPAAWTLMLAGFGLLGGGMRLGHRPGLSARRNDMFV